MLRWNLSHLLVTLPLVVVPVTGLALKPALAAAPSEEAVRILSRAMTVDAKCSYLSAAERGELSRYAARAEIAAASQASVKSAKAAAAAGRAEGSSANCSKDAEADTRETLEAARSAVAALAAAPAPDVAEPPAEKKPRKQAAAVQAEPDDEPDFQSKGGSLGRYKTVVRAYYLERECRSLGRAEQDRFYKAMVRLHRATVSASGARAVARVMHQAERNASGSSCGRQALAQIQKGYHEVTSR